MMLHRQKILAITCVFIANCVADVPLTEESPGPETAVRLGVALERPDSLPVCVRVC